MEVESQIVDYLVLSLGEGERAFACLSGSWMRDFGSDFLLEGSR